MPTVSVTHNPNKQENKIVKGQAELTLPMVPEAEPTDAIPPKPFSDSMLVVEILTALTFDTTIPA